MNLRSMTVAFFIFLLGMQSSYAQPGSIERYAWVGGNDDGTLVALMLSHFGASSHAPFAKLIIKEAGKSAPLYVDDAMKMSGGEKELAELGTYLLNKNAERLKKLGIKLSNEFLSEANVVTPPSLIPNVISGWIDIENDGLESFSVRSAKSEVCLENKSGIALTIQRNGVDVLTAQPAPDECWNDGFQLRNIFRTRKALWFVMNMHAYGLDNVDTYWVDVQGINTSAFVGSALFRG